MDGCQGGQAAVSEHNPDINELIKAGKALSKEVMVAMLNANAHEELIKAHADWKDAIDGKPNWGATCKK